MLLLLGDSHLARIRRNLPMLGPGTVRNLAVGGSVVTDIPAQAEHASGHADTTVISIGTNDANPDRGVPLEMFAERFTRVVASLTGRLVYLAPPGVVEHRLPPGANWKNTVIDHYRDAALDVCRQNDIAAVRADHVIRAAGPKTFADDGLHLSGTGYAVVLSALRATIHQA